MPTVIWGASNPWHFDLPETFLAWILLFVYSALFLSLIYSSRQTWKAFSRGQWTFLIILSGLAFMLSQYFPTQTSLINEFQFSSSAEILTEIVLTVILVAPYLLAGVVTGSTGGLIVGFFTGLGRALGSTHLLFDPFQLALAAWVAGLLMQQNYYGRLFSWLRFPMVSGFLSQLLFVTSSAFIVVVNSHVAMRGVMDVALSGFASTWPMILGGVIGGLLVSLIVRIWRRGEVAGQTVPPPHHLSIRHYLLTNYLLFAAIIFVIVTLIMFSVSMSLSRRLHLAEMVASSLLATNQISESFVDIEGNLVRFGSEGDFLIGDKTSTARALGTFYATTRQLYQVLVVSSDGSLIYAYPPEESGTVLTAEEQALVLRALNKGFNGQVEKVLSKSTELLSFVLPVQSQGQPSALVGRLSLIDISGWLEQELSDSSSDNRYIIDNQKQLVAQISGSRFWSKSISRKLVETHQVDFPGLDGQVYLIHSPDKSRDLVYVAPQTALDWHVAMVVPYENIVNQALAIALPLAVIFLAVAAFFVVSVDRYGRGISEPISELTRTSQLIAKGGSLATLVQTNRRDEVGRLSLAFRGMQLALKGRLEELSLLLHVSQDISSSVNIMETMPVVLKGALRGTGAIGARAIILNPIGKVPLRFAEGPAGERLSAFDSPLLTLMREKEELCLGTPSQIGAVPELGQISDPAIRALYALPLKSPGRFLGVLFLGFRQVHEFNSSEKSLLRALAGQARVIVENAYLFAHAEGGRRRLAAVLASTTEAVIVTDQTDRILMINRAMERAFQVSSNQVKNRAVTDVIKSKQLVEALTKRGSKPIDLEIAGKDRRIYFASVSPIVSRRGIIMGKVAVLHDISYFKEIDRLKSDFVSSVTHDLRTPLAVISSLVSSLLLTNGLTQEQRNFADNIVLNVERMTGLVDKLLDLARYEAGVDLKFEALDVNSLLKTLVDEHLLFSHKSGVSIRISAPGNLPKIEVDHDSMVCAISNLLGNAFKYAPNSGIVTLAAEHSNDEVIFRLQDNGPGIAKQDQIQLFEKFYRVKRDDHGSVKGTGIGLATVRTIAEKHGGRAWCESTLGEGSTFYFSVKVNRQLSGESAT
ncbi:MAG: ATP-binding protein [Candidatus Promineifilaceae bacterium]|nr:ATP-binding protein [Candidatus Promineifilaceae bacterium]